MNHEVLGLYIGLVNKLCADVEVPADLRIVLEVYRNELIASAQVSDPIPGNGPYWHGLQRGHYQGMNDFVKREAPLIRAGREAGDEDAW